MSDRYEYHSHCVFNLGYHIIFCPKYRRKVLQWSIDERLKILLVREELKIENGKLRIVNCQLLIMNIGSFINKVGFFPETPMTPEPDDAEKAAAALLDSLSDDRENRAKGIDTSSPNGEAGRGLYLALSERIREGREMEERVCLRWLTYCEQQLSLPSLTGEGSEERPLLTSLERELYARQDIADRVGGELKNRWQHCLAEVTVRLMEKYKLTII